MIGMHSDSDRGRWSKTVALLDLHHTVASDAWDYCTNDVFFRWGGKEEVRVDKWAMVLRGKNVDLGRRQSPRLFECKYEDLRRGKGAYVTAAEWTRAMRHQRSTFHHFVPIPPLPPPLLAAW